MIYISQIAHILSYWFQKYQIKDKAQNHFNKIENNSWTGFCTYRRFWKSKFQKTKNFEDQVLSEIPKEWDNYEVILANKIDLTKVKWIKVLKYGKKAFLINPKSIFFPSIL